MKRALIKILGITNLVFSGIAAIFYLYWLNKDTSVALSWGLPVLITAIFTLLAGIFTLRKRSLGWAFTGIAILGAGVIYFLILLVIESWV